MNAVIFEHVPLAELPAAWRAKLQLASGAQVKVRIEEETPQDAFTTDDPAFGIWSDRQDMQDVAAYVGQLREPRYGRDGQRKAP